MQKDYEKIGVKTSMVGSILLTSTAIIMALIAESQMILFDGLYTSITLFMSLISLKVINLVNTPETKERPFGYMSLEPLLNLGKSLVLLSVLVVFLVTNIQELTTGGRMISLDITTLYIFLCLGIYFIIIFYLRKCKKKSNSSILDLEIKNWYIDTALTVGIAISLGIANILLNLGYEEILPYIDPIVVIALVIVSFPTPLRAFIIAFRRLLLVSPENKIEEESMGQLQNLIAKHGLINTKIWGLKSGRTHYIFVYTGLKETQVTINHLDRIRGEIFKELSNLYPKFWADIMFTAINPDKPFPTKNSSEFLETSN